VRLASVEKGKLVVDPEAVQIFNKYGENEVAFVGNYGRHDAGKSFWYDKILNLSDFPGNNVPPTTFSTLPIAESPAFTSGASPTPRTISSSSSSTMLASRARNSSPPMRKSYWILSYCCARR
jgi:hypothetical protein